MHRLTGTHCELSILQRALVTGDVTHLHSQTYNTTLAGTPGCPDEQTARSRGDILPAWCQTPPWLPFLPCSSQLCMSSDMLATACLYSSPRTSRCLPMFLNWCWLGCKKQDGCEDKKNHGNLNFTPSLKIPSSSSWMPQSTVCKVPGFCTAVALDVGKPQEPNTPLVTLQCWALAGSCS